MRSTFCQLQHKGESRKKYPFRQSELQPGRGTTDVVALAMKAGASDAEAVAREGDEFSVNVRMGQVETLKESGSRGLGLRVFLGKRSASASTSDLTAEGIRQLVDGAMALAKVTEEDPVQRAAGDGGVRLSGKRSAPLRRRRVLAAGPERIEWARRAEAAALEGRPAHHQLRWRQL
jgi:PmbA protein